MATEKIVVAGFGDYELDGDYYLQGQANGYSFYEKTDETAFLGYFTSWLPYYGTAAYFLVKVQKYSNSVKIEVPKYRFIGTDVTATTSTDWVALTEVYGGESATGDTDLDYESSSSSSSSTSSYIENWSSSSTSYIENWSSSSEGYSSSSSSSSSSP